jgi:hypothetical protein
MVKIVESLKAFPIFMRIEQEITIMNYIMDLNEKALGNS